MTKNLPTNGKTRQKVGEVVAHVDLVRYTAKRTATGLKDVKREVIKTLQMDPDRLFSELAVILEPGFSEYLSARYHVKNSYEVVTSEKN